MNQNSNFKAFDVENVPLAGSNLIEASAGTGKTFSIAVLVLRLLLEKKIGVQEILMVTFTKAAVAELEERIRLFVRSAYAYSQGREIKNEVIKKTVDTAIKNLGEDEVVALLRSAVLNLDETAVMTIHGFCQQTLNEFAFETSQLFQSELLNDTTTVEEEEVQKFWRKNITSIEVDLLTEMIQIGLSRDMISKILKGHLSGKDYVFYDKNEVYAFDSKIQTEFYENIKKLKLEITEIENKLIQYIETHQSELIELSENNKYAKSSFLDKVNHPKEFIKQLMVGRDKVYVRKLFPNLLSDAEQLMKEKEKSEELTNRVLNYIFSFAIQEIVPKIEERKISSNLLSFDDMISNMHKALTKSKNEGLEEKLNQKYKAVFIDEFQDTDRQQYEIFKQAFEEKSIIFYIGDPKQSIYAWRKADISTYFEARNNVDNRYSMNINFRSSSRMVQALNQFFLPEPDFDTFHFGNSEQKERIDYHEVKANESGKTGELTLNGEKCAPVSIVLKPNNSELFLELSNRVLDLLTNKGYETGNSDENIRPSDIGILVRKSQSGAEIKKILSKKGIPAVIVTEDKILNSNEAKELVYLLEAMVAPSRQNVNRALLTSFFDFNTDKIRILNDEKAIQQFRDYLEYWKFNGVYTVLMKLISDFDVQKILIENNDKNGKRTLTNLNHLSEILYKVENRQHLGPVEVVDWLKINSKKSEGTNEELEQRIENDEDAVNILTIHKSKGLEYKIVFAPDLDMSFRKANDRVYSLRKKDGRYVSGKLNQFNEDEIKQIESQNEQENRRLVYVALTRAVYKCFVFRNTGNNYKNSTLSFFTEQIKTNDLIEKTNDPIEISDALVYRIENEKVQKPLVVQNFKLRENNWIRMSYSGLAAHNEYKIKEGFEFSEEPYDEFIFKELKKGTKTGNFLHFIFENLDFSKAENSNAVIKRAIKRFMPGEQENFEENIQKLIHHVVHANIGAGSDGFQMKQVPAENCLHELEFDFPVELFKARELEKLKDNGILVVDKYTHEIEGVMNGKIDLFFEHNGKYFVLDWKSNYLGPNLSDYSTEKVAEAMNESNYHLQYLIYSYAVKKFLISRLSEKFDFERDFGGVIYLFVRGLRENKNSGVFFYKPQIDQLNEMNQIFGRNELPV